jgi:Clr5-like protein
VFVGALLSSSNTDGIMQLVWKTEPTQRARRITIEVWQEYEEELRALYESKTLGEVMKEMGNKHNFWPS